MLTDFNADEDIIDLRELPIGFDPSSLNLKFNDINNFVQVEAGGDVRFNVTGDGFASIDESGSANLVANISMPLNAGDFVTIRFDGLPVDLDSVVVV